MEAVIDQQWIGPHIGQDCFIIIQNHICPIVKPKPLGTLNMSLGDRVTEPVYFVLPHGTSVTRLRVGGYTSLLQLSGPGFYPDNSKVDHP